ncbi:ribosomal RNA-processing protein 7, partial [Lecanoromycetidae sp. Uapishka_2]
MAPLKKTPSHVAGYDVFPLTLLPLPSLAQQVTHYLYITPHKPKIPTATAPRSLFLVNVPFDATEAHIKHLLSAQIGLPAGRVEDVEFEGQRRHVRRASEVAPTTSKPNKKNKKRKRNTEGESLDKLEGVALPATWDRDLHTNGLAAVVLFVDRVSMDAALRAIKSTRKERIPPTWGDNMEGKTPALGSANLKILKRVKF